MKIAIVGSTGNVGRRIVDEALRRGHDVTGIARDPSKEASRSPSTSVDLSAPAVQAAAASTAGHLRLISGDAADPRALAAVLRGHDVVVSALPFRGTDPDRLIEGVRLSGVSRYLVVGGAGSLEVAPGKLLIDAPHFPEAAREESSKGKAFLEKMRAVGDLDWTMLSPSALFIAGHRTGTFRLGLDTLLTGADGKSWVSFEDFAVAMLDEIERPAHVRRRFTVGY